MYHVYHAGSRRVGQQVGNGTTINDQPKCILTKDKAMGSVKTCLSDSVGEMSIANTDRPALVSILGPTSQRQLANRKNKFVL